MPRLSRCAVAVLALVTWRESFCRSSRIKLPKRTSLRVAPETVEALEIFGLDAVPNFQELRRAFRRLAAKTHPDVTGSAESFRRVVEAYRHLQSVDPSGGKDAVDEFLQDWLEESKVPGWGDFSQIERDTDDDGWAGRAALLNTFVRRHDAAAEGGVQEGDVVIYRLLQPQQNRGWGVGRIIALQVNYSRNGPNGLLHIQPLCSSSRARNLLEDDLYAEIAITRATDRLEVLSDWQELEDGSLELKELSRSHVRAVLSGMVFLDGSA